MQLIRFVPCAEVQVDLLSRLGRETYFETFAAMNNRDTMSAYLATAFNRKKLLKEIRNPDSLFLLLYADDQLAGYLKVNADAAQTDLQERNGLELERIYVKSAFQGKGLGKKILEKALILAKILGKQYLWLGVWEKNEKAIGFYTQAGFYRIGTHEFQMGDERQIDFIMKKELI